MTQDPEFSNHWIADEGMALMKDDVYAKDIWLGIHDSIENWTEGIPPDNLISTDMPPNEYADEINRLRLSMSIMEAKTENRLSNFASVETGFIATRSHKSGELLFIGNSLYKVISYIRKDNPIIAGTNVLPVTISDQYGSLVYL